MAIHSSQSIKAQEVVSNLEILTRSRNTPDFIRVDNGPEYISKALDFCAFQNGVKLQFSRPGKPTDNAFIESFNGSFRKECLQAHWFLSLDEAKRKIEAWRDDNNEYRPHSSLGYKNSVEFADQERVFSSLLDCQKYIISIQVVGGDQESQKKLL